MTVAELGRRMTPKEWRSWAQYYRWEREQHETAMKQAEHERRAADMARRVQRGGR